jgi:hypothetical protein
MKIKGADPRGGMPFGICSLFAAAPMIGAEEKTGGKRQMPLPAGTKQGLICA